MCNSFELIKAEGGKGTVEGRGEVGDSVGWPVLMVVCYFAAWLVSNAAV